MDIFSWAQWRAKGLSRFALDKALERGDVRRVLKGAYAWCDVPDVPETRAGAIALVRPQETVVARTTSAWLAGVDVLPPGRSIADEPVRLIVPPGVTPPRLPGCRASQAELPAADLVEECGVVRTSDRRTALDLGRFAPRKQAVAALDAFLNLERVTMAELWERTRLLTKVRNCRILRANLSVADAGAQSFAESTQRVLFIDAGLPRPRTQIPVSAPSGELLGYLDLGWALYLLGSEYDGEEHHSEDADVEADERRRGRMRAETPWTVDVARKNDLWGSPAGLVARTAELLLVGGWSPKNPRVLEQISRAAAYEAQTGRIWTWMPMERLLEA